jgi:hypothetical protein
VLKPDPPRELGLYVIGRPLMFVVWGLTLWGTAMAARLAWIAATDSSVRAVHLLAQGSVWVPIVIAVLMWAALFAALRNYRRRGEP